MIQLSKYKKARKALNNIVLEIATAVKKYFPM